MSNCCICQKNIEREDAPVLTMGAAGIPRLLCDECEALLDTVTCGREVSQIEEAMEEISRRMSHSNPDGATCNVLEEIMTNASERAGAIKSGDYDFSLDEADDESEDSFDEIPEDMLESEEDIEKDLEDERKMEKFNKVYNIILYTLLGITAGVLIWRLVQEFILNKMGG